jgi:EpsI family protein
MATLQGPGLTAPEVLEQHASGERRFGADHRWLVLSLLGVSALFWQTWLSYPESWWLNRKHAFGLLGLAIWLLWRARTRLQHSEPASPLVLAPLAVGSLIWALGVITDVQLVHQIVLPLLLLGWWYAVAGMQAVTAALPAFAAVVLTLPYWGAFVRPLQSLTVMANAVLLKLTSLEAQISGDYITIPAGVFEVARGCSGANYFESGVVISVVYGLLYLRHWRARGVALLVGGALAMVSNWLRVFGLILIGHATDMQSPLIRSHNGYGWVIFAITMSAFFLLARRIERYDESLGETSRLESPGEEPLHATSARRLILPVVTMLAGPAMLMLGSANSHGASSPTDVPGVLPGAEWERVDDALPDRWLPAFSGADEHRVSVWRRDSMELQVDRFIYLQQRQGKEMINAENVLVPESVRRIDATVGPINSQGRMVRASLLDLSGSQRLVWYWYRVAGVATHSPFEGKLLSIADYFTRGEPPELVVLSTSCSSEQCRDEQDLLFRFVTGQSPQRN